MLDSIHTAAIPSTVDAAGFVLVAGERAPHTAAGAPLKHAASCLSTCQRCKQHNVTRPLVVVARLEDKVPGGVQYHHTIADGGRPFCDACEEQEKRR